MARVTRVVLNRAALDAITLGMVDAFEAMAEAVVSGAHPPEDAKAAEEDHRPMLKDTGGTISYVLGRKVGGTNNVKKPKAIKVRSLGVVVAGGFGFPGHFAEFGTIHEPARPFLTPSLMATLPGSEAFIRAAMAHRLATVGERAQKSADIAQRIKDSAARVAARNAAP